MEEESGVVVPKPRAAGRPEFILVVSGMGGAWRCCCWRRQSTFRMDRIRWDLALAVPANPRAAGRPEFILVVSGMGGAWRCCCWRRQSTFRMDRIRWDLALAVPANP